MNNLAPCSSYRLPYQVPLQSDERIIKRIENFRLFRVPYVPEVFACMVLVKVRLTRKCITSETHHTLGRLRINTWVTNHRNVGHLDIFYQSFLCFSTFTSPFCYAIVIYVNLVTELATSEINLTWISRKEYALEHGQPSSKVWNMRTRAWWTYFYICLSSMVYIIYLSLETNNCIIYQSLRLAVSRCQQKPRKWICVMT